MKERCEKMEVKKISKKVGITKSKMMKGMVAGFLGILARRRLSKTKPVVIGVTGSFGKTLTKEAIWWVVSHQQGNKAGRSEGNLNTEFGMPMTILGASGNLSGVGAIGILGRAWVNSGKKPEWDKIVLEFGADGPGDIARLLKIAKPDVAVVTGVAAQHVAPGQFKDVAEVAWEKGLLPGALKKDGFAILNADDKRVREMHTSGQKILVGKNARADWVVKNVRDDLRGLKFELWHEGKRVARVVTEILGGQHVFALAAALVCSHLLGVEMRGNVFEGFKLPAGRFGLIEGGNGSVIVDSSYNAAPKPVMAALEWLKKQEGKRVAVLGQMNELGEISEKEHEKIGKVASESCDLVCGVFGDAEVMCEVAKKMNPDLEVKFFQDAEKCGEWLAARVKKDWVILCKGSQNKVRVEKVVKMLMKNPRQAGKLLVRQSEFWLAN